MDADRDDLERHLAPVLAATGTRPPAAALAAPVVVALWLTDLALGMVARVAPQVPVYFVGLPAKGLLAVGIVLVGLGAVEHAMAVQAGTWMQLARGVLATWS